MMIWYRKPPEDFFLKGGFLCYIVAVNRMSRGL
jgi:hypothetical protein